jgi:hypothetical protein
MDSLSDYSSSKTKDETEDETIIEQWVTIDDH